MLPRSINAQRVVQCLLLILAASFVGCGGNGSPRREIWGTVTWKGEAVPRGILYFGPDSRKGNTGPQGFALIKDGRYDTRGANSKGCIAGSNIALVYGCDGQGVSAGKPYGSNLFAPFEMPLEIPDDGGEINLTIPDTVPLAAPSSYEE